MTIFIPRPTLEKIEQIKTICTKHRCAVAFFVTWRYLFSQCENALSCTRTIAVCVWKETAQEVGTWIFARKKSRYCMSRGKKAKKCDAHKGALHQLADLETQKKRLGIGCFLKCLEVVSHSGSDWYADGSNYVTKGKTFFLSQFFTF